jgi:hypothetical protein
MYRVVRSVVLSAVLVHMVFGCCWHHAHAFGSQAGDTSVVETSCPCGHHGHEDSSEPGDHRSGDQGCDGDQCVFTLPETGSTYRVTIGADCLPFIYSLPTSPAVIRIDSADITPHHLSPPIPLHLLNQALLL